MYYKWFWSTWLVDSLSLDASILISVHPGASSDPWTFISGHKKANISNFGQNRRLKVQNMYFRWFWPTLIVDCISCFAFLLNSVHPGISRDLWTFISGQKMAKSVYLVKIIGSRSIICIFNDLDPLYWSNRYSLLLFYCFSASRYLPTPVAVYFGPQKAKIRIFGQNRRLMVHNMHFKWFWSTLLVDSISLVAFV